MVKNNQLKLLELTAKYKVLPMRFDLLMTLFPEFKCKKSIDKSYYDQLQRKGLLKKSNLTGCLRNQHDCYSLTKEGLEYCRKTGLISHDKNNRDFKWNSDQNKLIYRNAETRLFVDAYFKYLKNNSDFNSELFIAREAIVKYMRQMSNNSKLEFEYRSFRSNGLFILKNRIIPIYNLLNSNILLVNSMENKVLKTFLKSKFNLAPNKINDEYDQFLLAQDYSILDKLILSNGVVFNLSHAGQQKKNIFNKKENPYSFLDTKKQYLIVSKPEQFEVLELFRLGLSDQLLKDVIRNRIAKELIARDYGVTEKEVLESHPQLVVYETDNEIGFEIFKQELHHLNLLYELFTELSKSNNKKLVVYGLKSNKPIYDELFSSIANSEFREVKLR